MIRCFSAHNSLPLGGRWHAQAWRREQAESGRRQARSTRAGRERESGREVRKQNCLQYKSTSVTTFAVKASLREGGDTRKRDGGSRRKAEAEKCDDRKTMANKLYSDRFSFAKITMPSTHAPRNNHYCCRVFFLQNKRLVVSARAPDTNRYTVAVRVLLQSPIGDSFLPEEAFFTFG